MKERSILRIAKLIREKPSVFCNSNKISKKLSLNWRTVKSDLLILEKNGLLKQGMCDSCLDEMKESKRAK